MGDSEPQLPDDVVTVVNVDAWRTRAAELAVLLGSVGRQVQGPKLVPNQSGPPSANAELVKVSDPDFWAGNVAALSDAIQFESLATKTGQGLGSGAAPSGTERLTLTVEEAAASLGISRASAYEAVRRGEIPAIRIGRRLLVPKARLDRLLDATEETETPDE